MWIISDLYLLLVLQFIDSLTCIYKIILSVLYDFLLLEIRIKLRELTFEKITFFFGLKRLCFIKD